MTDEQKRELEIQVNGYSFDFYKRKKDGDSTEIPNSKFVALSWGLEVLGYEFVEDEKDEFLGVEYMKYKIVENNKIRRKEK